VSRIGDRRSAYGIFVGKHWGGGRGHMEDLVVCGRIILKCMLQNLDGRAWNWVHLAQDRDK
jgi:hypothetical protein